MEETGGQPGSLTSFENSRVAGWASFAVLGLGLTVLIGWALDVPLIKSLHPDWVSMKANTALCLVLGGAALAVVSRRPVSGAGRLVVDACGGLLVLIGVLTLIEYGAGLDLGIDQRLFPDDPGALGTSQPGRMSTATAIGLLLVGLALIVMDVQSKRGFWPAQFMAMAGGVPAFTFLVGYLYGAMPIGPGPVSQTQMAPHTAGALLVLSLGILWSRPERGLVAMVRTDCLAGFLARRLLPAGVAIPVLAGLLRILGQRERHYGTEFGIAIMATAGVVLFIGAVWVTGRAIERLDRERQAERRRLASYRDNLLTVMSHELLTPLNFITGFASVLADEVSGPLNPAQREQVARIRSGADRLQALIDDLLDLVNIRSGQLKLNRTRAAYGRLVDEALDRARADAAAKSLLLSADVQVPQDLCIDSRRVSQVLSNLLSNAVKFSPPGGRITVRAFPSGREIHTEITDTGPGILPANQEAIFESFSQLDMSRSRHAGGAGIGLSVSKVLVEAHGGTIGVRSRPGEGSTFWFDLPAEPSGSTCPPEPS